MITKENQLTLLHPLQEGDVFEYGSFFSKLTVRENLVWQVLEVHKVTGCDAGKRITFQLSWLGVFVGQVIANISGNTIQWSGACL